MRGGESHDLLITKDAKKKKAFDTIQHPFMIKTVIKLRTEGTGHWVIKAIYESLTVNTAPTQKGWKLSSKIGTKTRMPTLTVSIQHYTKVPARATRE